MKREEANKLIEQGVAELNEVLRLGRSETLERYLDVLSRFHRYSFNNAILIAVQRPDATHVAGFHTWRQLGNSVAMSPRVRKELGSWRRWFSGERMPTSMFAATTTKQMQID